MTDAKTPDAMSETQTGTATPGAENRIVFMFSGQGAQKPGMGSDLFDIPEVAATLECASDIFGYDVADFIMGAEAATLNDTRYAQPTLCALSVGIARALEARDVVPWAVLGFSLGQISALACAGMLSVEDTFELVKARAEIMANAAENAPGVMSALLKADEKSVEELCEKCAEGEVLVAANFNCPGQIVISGTDTAVTRAEEQWAKDGGRVSRLATSGAFHSPLMAEAACELAEYLEGVTFSEARIPLICNVDAAPLKARDAREHLARHLISPVRFEESVRYLLDAGANTFADVGYGGVLYGLLRRIDSDVVRINVQDRAGFDELVDQCATMSKGEMS